MRSWRTWPPRAWALLGALVLFSVAVLSVLYWAQFTGRAGSQRGLVIHNDLEIPVDVAVGRLATLRLNPGHEQTFVVKRDQFPADISVTTITSAVDPAVQPMFVDTFDYRELADAEFRLSIDEQGIHPTTAYRDTPVPGAATPEVSIVIENDLDRVPVYVAIGEQGREIQAASAEIFVFRRDDFPIYVYALQRETYYESFGRYVRGEEFELAELEVGGYRVRVGKDGISADTPAQMETP